MESENTAVDHAEEIRWELQERPARSFADFEVRWSHQGPWVAPGTRNHRVTADGIEREVRDDGEFVTVDDRRTEHLRALVVGREIVAIDREPNSEEDWAHGENSVTLTLSDGARLHFEGVGYDASALITSYAPSGEGT